MNIGVAYFQQMQALVTDKSVPCRQYQMGINQQPTPWNIKQSTETKISLFYYSQFTDQFSYRILREFSVFAKLKVLVFVVSWKLFVLDILAMSVKSGDKYHFKENVLMCLKVEILFILNQVPTFSPCLSYFDRDSYRLVQLLKNQCTYQRSSSSFKY